MGSAAFRVCSVLFALALSTSVFAQPTINALRANIGVTGSVCTIHSGTGAPGSGLGAVCDTYLRKDSPYTVYVKSGASTWSEIYRAGGTDVAVADGGTGLSSYTTGDLLYASGATTLAGRAAVASGQVLASAGTSTAPVYTATPTVTTLTGSTSVSSPLFTHSSAAQITTASGNLTIAPAGDITFNPTGNDLLPNTGYDLNIGALTNKFLTLHAAELWVETLVAQDTMATIGGRILVGPTTTLTADLASGGTSMTVKHNQIANGDRVVLQANGSVEWIAVTSGASGSAGAYVYSITRNLDGSGANNWTAGDAVFNTGTTADGYIDLYSVNGLLPGSTAGPTIVGNVRTGTTYSDVAPRWAIGNLNGLYGYGVDTYGNAFGDASNTYLTIDATNGIRMIGDSGTMFSMTAAGDATFAGKLTVGTGRNMLSNTEFIRGRGTGDAYSSYWGGSDSATTVDPSATYTCVTACGQRASHGSGWSWLGADEDTSGSIVIGADASGSFRPLGSNTTYFQISTGTPSNGTYGRIAGPVIPVDEDLPYEYSVYVALSGGWSTRARVLWYGADGGDAGDQPDYISEVDGSTVCTAGTASNDIGTWCRVGGIFTPPAGARIIVLAVISIYDGGDATPITFITKPFFAQATTGQTSLTPWGPGGQTLITGDMLSTDLVIANTLRSAGATSATAGTGYWLSASGTPTFRVGEPVSAGNDYLYWNGTSLALQSTDLTLNSSGVKIAVTTDYADTKGYAFDVATGKFGVYGYESATPTRSIQVWSDWTGTGQRNTVSTIRATNTPSSGGSNTNAYAIAAANNDASTKVTLGSSAGPINLIPSTSVDFEATSGITTRFRVFTNNGTTTGSPYIRSDGNYLVIESRSTANGGTIYLGLDNNTNINTGLGGGTTVINTALLLNGLTSCTLQVDGSGFVGCVSDRAAKTDIKSWKSGLDVVSKLRPVSYRWKDGTTDRHIGFIAQDVDEVIPDAVRKQEWGGMLTLDDKAILAALVNAVQELQRRK